jgi:glucose uptake protein
LIPLITGKVKNSRPTNQIFGVGLGASLFGIVFWLFNRPDVSGRIFLLSMISGMCWAIGQLGQFIAFTKMGVSKTMPISTGLQLVGNTLIGVLIFGEWQTSQQYLLGSLALVLIIAGVALTAISPDSKQDHAFGKDLLFLLLTTIGYWIYSAFPKTVSASSQALFLPQMLGILLCAGLYVLFSKQTQILREPATYWDMFAGLSFGVAALAYIYSAKANGVTLAFIYSQLCVIISTIGGMTLLGEHKHGKELTATLAGLALIVIGAIIS